MVDEEACQAFIRDLCDAYVTTEPAWVMRMRENPVVWGPHKPDSSQRNPLLLACCEFSADHPIHQIRAPWEHPSADSV